MKTNYKTQKVLLHSDIGNTSATGIVKGGIKVNNLTRLKSIVIEVDALYTAGAIGTFRFGGILNALLSSFTLTSSRFGNIINNATGAQLALIQIARPNGKNTYAKFGTSSATAALVTAATNYEPSAWVNLTQYYLEASFEFSLASFLAGQPRNLHLIDTKRDNLTIDIACMDKTGSLFLTSASGTLNSTSVKVFAVYTEEPDYNSQIIYSAVAAHQSTGEQKIISGNYYDFPVLEGKAESEGFRMLPGTKVAQYPNPDYEIGKVRIVKLQSKGNASSGSTTITAVEDSVPRDYEALILTGQNNATPFAPATGTTISEILVKVTDGDTEYNLIKSSAEEVQHDAFRISKEIDWKGAYPIIFDGTVYGTEHGYDASTVRKVVIDKTTTVAIDSGSIIVANEFQNK